jgi:hypothetical protein
LVYINILEIIINEPTDLDTAVKLAQQAEEDRLPIEAHAQFSQNVYTQGNLH